MLDLVLQTHLLSLHSLYILSLAKHHKGPVSNLFENLDCSDDVACDLKLQRFLLVPLFLTLIDGNSVFLTENVY